MATWKACGVWTMSLLSWTIFTKMYRKGKDCNPMYFEFKDNTSKYYQTEEEFQRVKDEISKKADINYLKNKLKELQEQINRDIEELEVINKELNDDNLIEMFRKYWELYEKVVFGMAIDIYFDDILCSKISKFLKSKIDDKKYNEYFSLLTSPMKFTRTQKEEIDFLRLLLEENPDFKEHLRKYAFIPMWFDNDPWKIEDLKKRAELYTNKDEIKDKLKQLESEINRRKQKCKEIIEELSPPDDILELINMIQEFAYVRQEGEVQISYHNYYGLGIREMICKRLDITLNDLRFLTDDEVVENLQNKNSNLINIIRERQKYCFMIAKDGEHIIYTGEKAEEEANKIKSNIKETKIIDDVVKGKVGSPGKAKGNVFVINNLDDIDKIQKGDIMIVSGTSIEYISAMEKSGGIVTEFGGITSHAAIIARELGKPCIIQVENATKIFKNGEFVELDAEEGAIKRLS